MPVKTCQLCGRAFEAKRSTARFCSPSCRKASHLAKQPIAPAAKPAPMPPASFDDVAKALDDARSVSNAFAQLSARAPRQLRPGCGRIAGAIARAIEEEEW